MFEWEAGSRRVQRALLLPPTGGGANSCTTGTNAYLLSAGQSSALLHRPASSLTLALISGVAPPQCQIRFEFWMKVRTLVA